MEQFLTGNIFKFVVLPLLIFCSRILDVSLGTVRIIFVNKGLKYFAPFIGFFEVLIWLVVIQQIMGQVQSPIYYIAYAGGFATGNYVGMYLEQKLAVGIALIRIITKKKAEELILHFRNHGYSITNVKAISNEGEVEIIFLPARRKEIPELIDTIKMYNPSAFYSIEDVKDMSAWALRNNYRNSVFSYDILKRKGK